MRSRSSPGLALICLLLIILTFFVVAYIARGICKADGLQTTLSLKAGPAPDTVNVAALFKNTDVNGNLIITATIEDFNAYNLPVTITAVSPPCPIPRNYKLGKFRYPMNRLITLIPDSLKFNGQPIACQLIENILTVDMDNYLIPAQGSALLVYDLQLE
jgi:hypothetical protein